MRLGASASEHTRSKLTHLKQGKGEVQSFPTPGLQWLQVTRAMSQTRIRFNLKVVSNMTHVTIWQETRPGLSNARPVPLSGGAVAAVTVACTMPCTRVRASIGRTMARQDSA